jgi:hypothetical protein
MLRPRGLQIQFLFQDPALERAYREQSEAERQFGDGARLFLRRMKQLEAAPNLAALDGTPAQCCPRKGAAVDQLVVRLATLNLVVSIDRATSSPGLSAAGEDRASVTHLNICGIENADA